MNSGRELFITSGVDENRYQLDIDEKTAIGIDIQAIDFKEPGKRKVSFSNSFSIPYTSNNARAFGYPHDISSAEGEIYFPISIDYWLNGELIIEAATVRVDEVDGERIKLRIFEKNSVWESIKDLTWPEFVTDFLQWMQDNKGLPSFDSPFTGTFSQFLQPYQDATEGIILPFYYGNLYQYEPGGEGTGFLEDENEIWIKHQETASGGHFCVFVKTIFEYIEDKYNVDFLTGGGVVDYNIWDDAIAPQMFVPIRDLDVGFIVTTGVTGYYFKERNINGAFEPHEDTLDKADKNLSQLVNGFLNHFNGIIDKVGDAFAIRRFDDLKNTNPVNFGRLAKGKIKFKPAIQGYGQKNYITFAEVFEGGDKTFGRRTIFSANQNTDPVAELFEIDAFINNFIKRGPDFAPNLSKEESFKTFSFFVPDGTIDSPIDIKASDNSGNSVTANLTLQKAALYDLSGEYTYLEEIITYPVVWEVEKWLTMEGVRNIEFFRQYYIQELGGSFFINKISGFNPDKSNAPTKLELIKISNKVPIPVNNYETSFWVDGKGNPFVDGDENLFV